MKKKPIRTVSTTAKKDHGKNLNVLVLTALLFAGFMIAEAVGAYLSHSLSLLGDAAAMSVDVVTYFCSIWAEYAKHSNGGILSESTRLWVEVYIPIFSLLSLLTICGWVTSGF